MKTQKESQSRPTPGYRMPDMDRFLGEPLIPGKKIADVSFNDKEIPGYFVGDKKTVFDLFCTTERKETFIVEMQLHGQSFFTDRVLFYSTYPLREQIVTPLEEERIRRMREAGDEDWQDKVPKRNYRLKVGKEHPEKCLTTLEKIAFAFQHISFLQERPESFSGEFFEHLFHASELAGMSLDERNQYDKDMTTEIDKIAQLDYAMEQGLSKGLKQGLEQGRKNAILEVARKMLADGMDISLIVKYSGLSPEEIGEP